MIRKKLKKAEKSRWIAALRSGRFFQFLGCLRSVDSEGASVKHCCLGVFLEDVVGLKPNTSYGSCFITPTLWTNLIPIPDIDRTYLADANDGISGVRPHTFADIADWIEWNL